MSAPRVFFDTTVLVYAISRNDERVQTARELLALGGYISVQVLSELTSVARRKLKMPWADLLSSLSAIRELCETPAPVTLDVHEAALGIAERYGCRIYDSLMIASALKARCAVLYSEDMQDGQRIDTLTLRNPFVH